jgi:hypothetical protein
MDMTSESNTTEMKPLAEMTRDELRKLAAELEIPGRGTMLKPALVEAIALERAARIEKAHCARQATVAPAPVKVKRPGRSGQGVPMTDGKRRLNYFAQNGVGDMERFTPKQRRRYEKKATRNARIAALASLAGA